MERGREAKEEAAVVLAEPLRAKPSPAAPAPSRLDTLMLLLWDRVRGLLEMPASPPPGRPAEGGEPGAESESGKAEEEEERVAGAGPEKLVFLGLPWAKDGRGPRVSCSLSFLPAGTAPADMPAAVAGAAPGVGFCFSAWKQT